MENYEIIPLTQDVIQPNSQTFDIKSQEVFDEFLANIDAVGSSKKEYKIVFNLFSGYLEEKNISRPSRKDVISYKEALIETGHSPRTVRLYLSVLKRYFSWLDSVRYYPNITYNLSGPRINKEPRKQPLTSDQVADILKSIDRGSLKGKQTYALILLASTTGLRSGELASLNIGDWINIQDKTFLTVLRKGYQEKQMVAIGPEADRAIRDCLKDRGIYKLDEPLFISTSNRNRGQAITPKSIGRILKNVLSEHGFNSSYFTGHSFRHTAATLGMSVCENDIFTVKKFMGHSNIETTILYADHNELLGQDVAARIEAKLLLKSDNENP